MNFNHFLMILGKGYPPRTMLSCAALSLLLFFYVFTLGSFLMLTIYPLLDRVVYTTNFANIFIISPYWDHVVISILTVAWIMTQSNRTIRVSILLFYSVSILISSSIINLDTLTYASVISLPIIVVLLFLSKYSSVVRISVNNRLFTNHFALVGCLIGFLSLGITILYIFNPFIEIPSMNFLYYMFLIFSTASPVLIMLTGIINPSRIVLLKIKKQKHEESQNCNQDNPYRYPLEKKARVISVSSILVLSIVIAFIPQIHSNDINSQVSSDTQEYVKFITDLQKTSSITELIEEAFVFQINGDRPLTLLFFYLMYEIFESTSLNQFVEYLPLILSPILVLSIYFLTRELTDNEYAALLAAYLTIFSFQVSIGIYAGLFANWLALSFAFFGISFALRFAKRKLTIDLIAFAALMVTLLLSHAPTWTIFVVIVSVFFLIHIVTRPGKKKVFTLLLLALLPSITMELTRTFIVEYGVVEENLSFGDNRITLFPSPISIWNNLIDSNHIYFAGLFGNSIVFGLTLVWLVHKRSFDKSTILFSVCFLLALIFIIFGDEEIQSRILYQIPYQIPISLALLTIKQRLGLPIFIMLNLWLTTITIRNLSNLNFEEL